MRSGFSFILLLQVVSAQFGDILSYKYQRYSECSSLLQTCQPTKSQCASIVCAQCTDLGQTRINNCCSQAAPLSCFIAGAGGNTQQNYITTLAPDPNLSVCSTALNYITACESLTPGFSDLANSDEASCLCYSSTSWNPTGFDAPWSSCVAWAKTANTTLYPELSSNAGMCASVGNLLKAPASGTASTTAVATSAGNSGKTTATSAPATPVGNSGSGTIATPTSAGANTGSATVPQTSAKATVGSTTATPAATTTGGAASILRNMRTILAIQVLFVGIGLNFIW